MLRQKNIRPQSGLAITTLLVVIAIFIIGPISMFVYEMARYNLASQQLKFCVDSAALSAAASTTASNSGNTTTDETTAMNQAAWMFSQNSILDQSLAGTPAYTYGTASATLNPAANQALLYFQFLDPVTKQPVGIGSPNGKILQVTGAFGFVPVTSKYTNIIGPYTIVQTSDGGLPMLDVILCFDISASMDDFTMVTLANRYNAGTIKNLIFTQFNQYSIATPNNLVYTDTSGNQYLTGQGPLYYALGCTSATGTPTNATWPIQLQCNGSSTGYGCQLGSNNHGTNTGAGPSISAPVNGSFTDLVVNIDGTQKLTKGVTVNGFYFPPNDSSNLPLGILIEAQRGNLESVATATLAGINTTSTGFLKYPGFSFRPGWFQAYYTAAMSLPTSTTSTPIRRPIGDAIQAARTFFSVLDNDADVHFGMVTFSDDSGASPTDTVTSTDSIGSTSPSGSAVISPMGFPTYSTIAAPNPTIFLNPAAGPTYSNYDSSTAPSSTSVNGCMYYSGTNSGSGNYGINTLLAEGGTNIADALDRALAMHLGTKSTDPSSTSYGQLKLGRVGATRAIVLFTDGMPTAGGDNAPSSWANSINEAKIAKTAGIPIYTIGLCLVPSLQSTQQAVLSNNTTTYPNGLAGLSGNGATFAQTTDSTQLTAVFQNVARQLVQLVRSGN